MVEFKISSFCNLGGCVEVGRGDGVVLVRDTKNRDRELEFTHEEWAAFVLGVKRGEFDLTRGPA